MEKTKNVFLFWIGDQEKISSKIELLEKMGLNPIVGPSSSEHEFLYKEVPYYRNSYDQKVWSFCSDVWRVYVLSRYAGLYVDVTSEIGVNFHKFFNEAISKDVWLFKEQYGIIASAILGSGVENNHFYKSIFNEMKKVSNKNVKLHPILPMWISGFMYKNYPEINLNNWERFENAIFTIDILPVVRDKSTIYKYGSGSWTIKQITSKQIDPWQNAENRWNNKTIRPYWIFTSKMVMKYGFDILHVDYIRNMYDIAKSKEELDELKNEYARLPFRKDLPISFRLIWSRLYRLFNK